MQQPKPVHLGHVEIADDKIERLQRGGVHRRLAVLGLVDVAHPDFLKRHAGHLTHAVLVVDDQNLKSCSSWHFRHS